MPKTIHVIQGAPGTGKTHKLLEVLQEKLKTYKAEEIAYVSFSRKGTYAGVDLAKEAFSLTDKDCRYFKTMHSIAYHELHMTKLDLYNGSSADKKLRTTMLKWGVSQEELHKATIIADRARNIGTDDVYAIREDNEHLQNTAAVLQKMRKEAKDISQTKDFTDMLQECVDLGITLPVKIAFIDEAQDLTPLQWQCARTFFKNCEEIWLAGDLNQSLFTWAGADVEAYAQLNAMAVEVIQLDKSYRCTASVWTYAKFVQSLINVRDAMPLQVTQDDIGFADTFRNLDVTQIKNIIASLTANPSDTLYCLGISSDCAVRTFVPALMALGLPFTMDFTNSAPRIAPLLYNRLRKAVSKFHIKSQYEEMFEKVHDRKSNHQVMKDFVNTCGCPQIWQFRPKFFPFGQTPKHLLAWCANEILGELRNGKITVEQAQYFMRMCTTGTIVQDPDRIKISTVAKQKGGEATYVLFNPTVTAKVHKQCLNSVDAYDNIMRSYYVAVTRAKKGVAVLTRLGENHDLFPEIALPTGHCDVQYKPIKSLTVANWTREETPSEFFTSVIDVYAEDPLLPLPTPRMLAPNQLPDMDFRHRSFKARMCQI